MKTGFASFFLISTRLCAVNTSHLVRLVICFWEKIRSRNNLNYGTAVVWKYIVQFFGYTSTIFTPSLPQIYLHMTFFTFRNKIAFEGAKLLQNNRMGPKMILTTKLAKFKSVKIFGLLLGKEHSQQFAVPLIHMAFQFCIYFLRRDLV